MKRFMNSARGVESSPMVSGERPSERQPRQSGSYWTKGRMRPWVTSGAVLNEVVTAQKIGNRQMKAQSARAP